MLQGFYPVSSHDAPDSQQFIVANVDGQPQRKFVHSKKEFHPLVQDYRQLPSAGGIWELDKLIKSDIRWRRLACNVISNE